MRVLAVLPLFMCLACASSHPTEATTATLGASTDPARSSAETPATAPDSKRGQGQEESPAMAWADVTRAPWPVEEQVLDVRATAIGAACGEPDAGVAKVARYLADERARGLGAPDPDAVAGLLRAAGVPYLRPRVLGALGRGPLDDVALKARAAQMKTPLSRCAVAIARTPHGGEVVVGIAADALGDLAAIPTHARTGEWLAFDARLALPARGATLVILGPHGAPRTVPTSYDARTGRTKARFALDRPGAFKVQLVADVDEDRESGETHGPRPLLEAKVYADVPLPATLDAEPAPGEEAANGATGADAVARMVDAARASEGLAKLVRDPRLEELAKRHVERMRDRGAIAHDIGDGDGDAKARFEAEDGFATRIGENVAKASSEAAAHRALWDSPSHRMNLIRADYTHVGIATATAPDGTVFVCEVFASRPKR